MYNRHALDSALGRHPADAVIQNGNVVSVYTGELLRADVAITDGVFVAIGDVSELVKETTERIDAAGSFIVPGLIDTHVHVEASKMSLSSYARAVLPHGTTCVYSAFDHIASVLGLNGVRFMLEEGAGLPLRVFNPLPCKVPHTIPPSTLGGSVTLQDQLEAFDWPDARGIAEVAFDYILRDDADILGAIEACEQRRLLVHGDGPTLRGLLVGAFMCAGMRDDHEMTSLDETVEKLRSGVYCLIRESPAAHNLEDCVRAITELGLSSRRVALCTDDVDPTTLVEVGHIDHCVREAIRFGVEPISAIQMATLNGAEALRLDDRIGGVAPGRYADFLLVPSLEEFNVQATYVGGRLIAQDGAMVATIKPPTRKPEILSTFSLSSLAPDDFLFRTNLPDGEARVLTMFTSDGTTREGKEVTLRVQGGVILPDPDADVAYISVIERFNDTGSRSTAFMSGFSLGEGALATSNAPDDGNVVCLGADTLSMATAVNRIAELGGGQVVAKGTEVLAELPLPIAGIMTDLPPNEVRDQELNLNRASRSLGVAPEKPFAWLMFTTITTLPFYSLTDRGFVEHKSLSYMDPVLGGA